MRTLMRTLEVRCEHYNATADVTLWRDTDYKGDYFYELNVTDPDNFHTLTFDDYEKAVEAFNDNARGLLDYDMSFFDNEYYAV